MVKVWINLDGDDECQNPFDGSPVHAFEVEVC